MKQSHALENVQSLLFFPFTEAGGMKKLFIGAWLCFASFIIPILPWLFILGYSGMIARRIIVDKDDPHMPEWDNWNDMLGLGAKLFGVYFVYSAPAAGAMMLGYLTMMTPAFLGAFAESGSESITPEILDVFTVGMFAGIILFMIGMILSLALWIVLPPALTHTAVKSSFLAGFQIRDWWKIFRVNAGGFIIALVLAGGLYMLFMFALQIIYVTIVLCILLPFLVALAGAYLCIILFVLTGQAYREGLDKLEIKAG